MAVAIMAIMAIMAWTTNTIVSSTKLAALRVSIWKMLGHCFCLASGPSHTLSSPVKYYLHNSLRWETFTLKLCVCDRPHHHGAVMCGA